MSQPVRLDQLSVALAVIVLFGALGCKRGLLREVVAAPTILVAPLVGPWLGTVLQPWVNRFHKLFMFARFGGLATDDLTVVVEKVKQVPPLICTEADVARLGVVIFLLIIACGYLIGQWRVKGPADRAMKILGGLMGAFNGFMLAQIVLPRFWTAQFAVVVVPTASVLQLFHGQFALALVVAFVVLVVFALRLARK